VWYFPAGCCGSFFRGEEEVKVQQQCQDKTSSMPRQNHFIAVFCRGETDSEAAEFSVLQKIKTHSAKLEVSGYYFALL